MENIVPEIYFGGFSSEISIYDNDNHYQLNCQQEIQKNLKKSPFSSF